MATLAGIQKQIADLEKQADAIRRAEAGAAADKVKELIARHGLTAEDVGLAAKAVKAGKKFPFNPVIAKSKPAARPAGIAKYRDPKSGKTWTGNGKAPGWIAGAKNRDKFLISVNAAMPAADAAPAELAVVAKSPRKRAVSAVQALTPDLSKVATRKTRVPKATEAVALPTRLKKAAGRKSPAKKAVAAAAIAESLVDGGAVVASPVEAVGA